MTDNDIGEKVQRFLVELYLRTQGDSSIKVSMYDIGEVLGLDRRASFQTAEELLVTGLAELKTLSGGIGITTDGVAEARQLGVVGEGNTGPSLGNAPVLDETGRQAVEQISTRLKSQMGEKGLDFDQLAEMLADLKSIDTQLSSPKPKTAIIRECFQSIKGVLQKSGDADSLALVKILLGD
jgi:hypothetical protein